MVFAEVDQRLGRLLGAFLEADLAHLAGGEQLGIADGELQSEAGQFQGIIIDGPFDQLHADKPLDALAEAFALFDEAHAARSPGLNDREQSVQVMFEFLLHSSLSPHLGD
jgi:hypothetical protein